MFGVVVSSRLESAHHQACPAAHSPSRASHACIRKNADTQRLTDLCQEVVRARVGTGKNGIRRGREACREGLTCTWKHHLAFVLRHAFLSREFRVCSVWTFQIAARRRRSSLCTQPCWTRRFTLWPDSPERPEQHRGENIGTDSSKPTHGILPHAFVQILFFPIL